MKTKQSEERRRGEHAMSPPPPPPPELGAELAGEHGLLEESSPQGTQKEIKKRTLNRKSKKKQTETHSVSTLHEVMVHGEPKLIHLKHEDQNDSLKKEDMNDQSSLFLEVDHLRSPQNNMTDSLHASSKRTRRQAKVFGAQRLTSTITKELESNTVQSDVNNTQVSMDEISPILNVSAVTAVFPEKKRKRTIPAIYKQFYDKMKKSRKNAAITDSTATLVHDQLNSQSKQVIVRQTKTPKSHHKMIGKSTKKNNCFSLKLPDQLINATETLETASQVRKNKTRKALSKKQVMQERKIIENNADHREVMQVEHNTATGKENTTERKIHLEPLPVSEEQTPTTSCLDVKEEVVSHYFTTPSQEVKTTTEESDSVKSNKNIKVNKWSKPATKRRKWQNPNPPTVVKVNIKASMLQSLKSKEVPVSSEIPVTHNDPIGPLDCNQEIEVPKIEGKIDIPTEKYRTKSLTEDATNSKPLTNHVPILTDVPVSTDGSAETPECIKKNVPVSNDVLLVSDESVKTPKCTQKDKTTISTEKHKTKPSVNAKITKRKLQKNRFRVVSDGSVETPECTQKVGTPTVQCNVAVSTKKCITKSTVTKRKRKKNVVISTDFLVMPYESVEKPECGKVGVSTVQSDIAVPTKKYARKQLGMTKPKKKLPKRNVLFSPDFSIMPDGPVETLGNRAQTVKVAEVQRNVTVSTNKHSTKPSVTKSKRKKNVSVSTDFSIVPNGSFDTPECTQKIEAPSVQCDAASFKKTPTTKPLSKAKAKIHRLKKKTNSPKPKLYSKGKITKKKENLNAPNHIPVKQVWKIAQKYVSNNLENISTTSMETVSTIGQGKNTDGRSPSISTSFNLPYPLPIRTVLLHRLPNDDYQVAKNICTLSQSSSSSSESTSSSGTSTSPSPAQMSDNCSDIINKDLELSSSSSMASIGESYKSLFKEITLFYEREKWSEYCLNFNNETEPGRQESGNSPKMFSSNTVHSADNYHVDCSSHTASLQSSDKYLPMPKKSVLNQSGKRCKDTLRKTSGDVEQLCSISKNSTTNIVDESLLSKSTLNAARNASVESNISSDVIFHGHSNSETPSNANKTSKDPSTSSQSNKTCNSPKYDSIETKTLKIDIANLTEGNQMMCEVEEEDLDVISLHAYSLSSETFENIPSSHHLSDTIKNTPSLIKAPSLAKSPSEPKVKEPITFETIKPMEIELASTKFTCEKKNADSTSLLVGKSATNFTQTISDHSKNYSNMHREDETPAKHVPPEIPTNQAQKHSDHGFNSKPRFIYCAGKIRIPKCFFNVCQYNLTSNCTVNTCKKIHISLTLQLRMIKEMRYTPHWFAQEYLYLRSKFNRFSCFESYLEVFMEHCVNKKWYRFLLEIMRDACNYLMKPQAIVEKTLHTLRDCNLHQLKMCSDILGYEIKYAGPKMIHYLLLMISKSPHFVAFKSVLINLLSIAYENNEKVEMDTAIMILEQVCSLPLDLGLLEVTFSRVLKNTSNQIFFRNNLMQRFKQFSLDAAKENKEFRPKITELDEMIKPLDRQCTSDNDCLEKVSLPAEYRFGNPVRLQESTTRTSPDTTQFHDFVRNPQEDIPGPFAGRFHEPHHAFPRPRFCNPDLMHNQKWPMRNTSGPTHISDGPIRYWHDQMLNKNGLMLRMPRGPPPVPINRFVPRPPLQNPNFLTQHRF